MIRAANVMCTEEKRVKAYLPHNYDIVRITPLAITIQGEDEAGWTLDGYVIPRLASGLITAVECEPLELDPPR